MHAKVTNTVSTSLVLYAFEKLWGIARPVRSNSSLARFWQYDGNLIGGVLLGFGMALSGACPGTTIVQMAQGVPSARSTIIGAVAGAAAYSRCGNSMKGKNQIYSTVCKKTLQDSTPLPGGVVVMGLGAAVAALLYLTKATNGAATTTPIVGGLLIGGSQAASLLLTGNSLGVSTSYEQASRYLLSAIGASGVEKPNWPEWSRDRHTGVAGATRGLCNGVRSSHGGWLHFRPRHFRSWCAVIVKSCDSRRRVCRWNRFEIHDDDVRKRLKLAGQSSFKFTVCIMIGTAHFFEVNPDLAECQIDLLFRPAESSGVFLKRRSGSWHNSIFVSAIPSHHHDTLICTGIEDPGDEPPPHSI
jgi:hypothetical protein